jgi:LysR family glycine cleavage system transcriptional activator
MSDPLATIPLSAIRVFEAAARTGNFTKAAAELGMTQAAVSWQVKALEKRLDAPLFVRLPRAVVLTPAGERLARAASEAITNLRSALAEIADEGATVLAVTTVETFATRWLAGRLGRFQVAHPQIAVRLDSDVRVRDLLRGEADLAIRSARRQAWPGLEAIFLFPTAQTALLTPEAMAQLGPAPRPQDLLEARRVGREAEWAEWFRNSGVEAPRPGLPTPQLTADTQGLEVSAAMAMGGAAIGSPVMFASDIAAGRLRQPFEVYIAEDAGYWLLYPQDRRRARKIAAFREWLLAEVAKDEAAQRLLQRRPREPPGESDSA